MDFGILNAVQSAIILCLDLYVMVKAYASRRTDIRQRYFNMLAFSASVVQLMSLFVRLFKTKLIYCGAGLQYTVYILMFISMVFTAWGAMHYLLYLRRRTEKLSSAIKLILLLPCIIMTAAAISSPWTGWLFSIDASLNYHRGSLFFLQLLCPYIFALAAIVMMAVMLIRRSNEEDRKAIPYFLCFIVPTTAGAVLQVALNIDGGYSAIGVSVSVILLYMEFYVDEIKELEHLKDVEVANTMLQKQLDEIAGLNKELSAGQERLILNNEIISSISKLYFAIFRIDLEKDFYEEISSDNDVHRLTGHEGRAYERMMELCDNFVTEEYDSVIREFFNLNTLPERLSDTETIEAVYLAKDGNWHQARFISKRRDEAGRTTHVLYVTRLVSAEKIKEMESARKLEEASRAKSTFLFNMSHDIRTPMNAIIGYTELMDRYFDDRERCRSYLQKVRGSSDFLLSLINNVLEMARIESGKAVIDEEPISTLDIFKNLRSVYEELMRNKNISFRAEHDVNTSYILCDKVKVNEIFLNLLSNAYKYTPAGGMVSLEARELPCEREGYTIIQTTISDTGIGMSKEYLPIIFDEFTRERTTTEAKIQGTGLGMPIVKRLVELMEGTITVESELGKGTTFVVTLPHRIADETDLSVRYPLEASPESFEGMRILLAEDNDLNAEIAAEILADAGFITERAEDGIVCVDMLSKSPKGYYDLILMDIQMPNMDGYKATHVIRAMEDSYRREIPIIAMTANAFDEDRQNAISAGMNAHVAKPVDIDILYKTIADVMAEKREELKTLEGSSRKKASLPHVRRIISEMESDRSLQVMPGGFFAYDAHGREELIYANERACRIWGCSSFEELCKISGGTFAGLVHPDDYERVNKSVWEQIDGGSDDLDQVEYRIIRKDGSVRRIMDYGRIVRDKNLDIFYVFVSDITDHQTNPIPADGKEKETR